MFLFFMTLCMVQGGLSLATVYYLWKSETDRMRLYEILKEQEQEMLLMSEALIRQDENEEERQLHLVGN